MPLNWGALSSQIRGLAENTTLQRAELGIIPWTGSLARAWNHQWLVQYALAVLQARPSVEEEVQCGCGGWCRVFGVDANGLLHQCTRCHHDYHLAWSAYRGQPPGAGPA